MTKRISIPEATEVLRQLKQDDLVPDNIVGLGYGQMVIATADAGLYVGHRRAGELQHHSLQFVRLEP